MLWEAIKRACPGDLVRAQEIFSQSVKRASARCPRAQSACPAVWAVWAPSIASGAQTAGKPKLGRRHDSPNHQPNNQPTRTAPYQHKTNRLRIAAAKLGLVEAHCPRKFEPAPRMLLCSLVCSASAVGSADADSDAGRASSLLPSAADTSTPLAAPGASTVVPIGYGSPEFVQQLSSMVSALEQQNLGLKASEQAAEAAEKRAVAAEQAELAKAKALQKTVDEQQKELATLRAEVRAQTADKRSLEADQETLHKQMASLRSKQSKAEAQEKRLAEHEHALHERETALLERLTAPQPPPPNASSTADSQQEQPPRLRRSPRASSSEVRAEAGDLERSTSGDARRLGANLRRWGGGDERRTGGLEQPRWSDGDAGDDEAWARRRGAPEAAWVPPPRLRASEEDFFF